MSRDLGIDAAWSWFNDPHVICQRTPGGANWMHVGYVASNGDVGVAHLDVDSGRTASSILHRALEVDDHDPASLLVMADGTLLACYSRHEAADGFRRRRTTDPEDPASWAPETHELPAVRVVYPKPVRFASGRMFVFYRRSTRSQYLIFSDDDGASWSAELPLLTNGGERPYVNLQYSAAADLVDLLYTDGHPRNENNSLWHVTVAADGEVGRTDGSPIRNAIASGPIACDEGTAVYDAARGDGEGWGWNVCRDPRDSAHVHAVFARFPGLVDDFSSDTIGAGRWTFAAGAGSASIARGRLVPAAAGPDSETRLIRNDAELYDCEVTAKFDADSPAPRAAGVIAKSTSGDDGVFARLSSAPGALTAGALSGGRSSAAFRPQPGTTYWIRLRTAGDTLTAEAYTAPPPVVGSGAAAVAVSHTLAGPDARAFGRGTKGSTGICWAPGSTAGRVAEFAAYPLDRATGDHRYCHAHWDGVAWRVNADILEGSAGGSIYPAGVDSPEPFYSGGIHLLKSDPRIVYLSRRTGPAAWEIERWRQSGRVGYRSLVLRDRPLAYYRLGDASGAVAADERLANPGRYVNAPALGEPGAIAGDAAVAFDAARSQRVELTTLEELGLLLPASSYELWIRTTTAATCSLFGCADPAIELGCRVNSDGGSAHEPGSLGFAMRAGGAEPTCGRVRAAGVSDGRWHHVAIVVTAAASFDVYIDGELRAVTYRSRQPLAAPARLELPLALACRNDGGAMDEHFTGALDEVAFYPYRLSHGQIRAHALRPPAFVLDEAIDGGPAAKNIRPVCPSFPEALTADPPDAVWMTGSYSSYTDYATRLAVTVA
jgi:BNR repeat-containing family member/Concanavalin A-like lectin/glucanases superfamily